MSEEMLAVVRRLGAMENEVASLRRELDALRSKRGALSGSLRCIEVGKSADFGLRVDGDAQVIRSLAYRVLGRGNARCERVSKKVLRVHRLKVPSNDRS